MWKTILRRVLIMIPQLLIVSILTFMLAKLMPGDPFSGRIGPHTDIHQLNALRHAAGLDQPWYQQYIHWMGNVFHGDFGQSFQLKAPVRTIIGDRLGNTVYLSLIAMFLTYLIAIGMALIAARKENSRLDRGLVLWNSFVYTMPSYLFYLFGIFIFGYVLGIFPTSGTVDATANGFFEILISRLYHMILPALTVAIIGTTATFTYLRTGILDEAKQEYVKLARAKGVPEKKIMTKHILRNAFLPIASTMGYSITAIFGGMIIAETIFSFPGVGKLFIDSVLTRDYPIVTTLVLFNGALAVVGGLLSDIIMSIVDPRIRIQ
ncbi:ABC transporter permease [Weissella diestrammenae]|uniref:ABC transporter permease n=1 Tax=Weissella diestrammenae TaxID=1162633 RepID=A0A7G9T3P0_9LACO|nr:ABC transporter permease [Weissella diestrammenae]MCM0582696.1 ABC transporter permease [Weissella diestrammenae]QNN74715.1 ABC transporter permease [Weissella diestrammenae]